MASGNVKHQRKTIATANASTFFWIPICHTLHIKVSEDTAGRNNIDLHWKLIKSEGANIEEPPASQNLGSDYASFAGNSEGAKFSDVRINTTYLLLVSSNRANTTVEVTTFS